ncbi:MAG TPA: trypsin-like peptidase domain-containing protein [Candidatus Saccharimonadales bacterium]|nr:trypsin-like peptidase domain-containing protein [Candidatus Saccharimonadales bacterium]
MGEADTNKSGAKATPEAREHSVSSGVTTHRLPLPAAVERVKYVIGKYKPALNRSGVLIIAGILVSAVVGYGAGWLGATHRANGDDILTGTTSPQKQVVTSESQLINSIAQTVGPSVVSVNVTSTTQGSSYFSYGLPQSEQSAGTGIILTSSGLIITNRHVVPDGTTSVSVTLSDGTQLKDVSVLGRTSDSSSLDIAFLKVNNTEGKKLVPAVLGDSSKVQVGDAVVAIGNALGQFQNTVTSGIISGYGRSVQAGSSDGSQASENLDDLFQTDAAINEGNSGGPLVNMNGQVIGINTAIAGDAQNIGFSIPINDVIGLIQQVESTGKFQQPYIGVYYVPVTDDVAQQYSLSTTRGAWIPPVGVLGQDPIIANGPAAKAGLQAGDIITKIDGTAIDQNNSLTAMIDKDKVGQTITLTIVRSGKTKQLNVTLGATPADTNTSNTTTQTIPGLF